MRPEGQRRFYDPALFLVSAGIGYEPLIDNVGRANGHRIVVALTRVNLEFDALQSGFREWSNLKRVQRRRPGARIHFGLQRRHTQAAEGYPIHANPK